MDVLNSHPQSVLFKKKKFMITPCCVLLPCIFSCLVGSEL